MTLENNPRSALAGLILLLFTVAGPAVAETRDALTHFFYQSFGDLPDELATARSDGLKGLFVMFDDPDCPWCQKMKATVLNQSEVQDYYRARFRPITVDTRGDDLIVGLKGEEMSSKDYAAKVHRVRATPVILFVDLDGNVMHRFTGATKDVQEFLWLGEFVADGHYRNERFQAFKKQKRLAATTPSGKS
ncbi:MAG: thioredoxin family protein [Gammaproteobacteria bacterium]|nr:thioredoxin family protein [Gammaproteobacteria bacterium]